MALLACFKGTIKSLVDRDLKICISTIDIYNEYIRFWEIVVEGKPLKEGEEEAAEQETRSTTTKEKAITRRVLFHFILLHPISLRI